MTRNFIHRNELGFLVKGVIALLESQRRGSVSYQFYEQDEALLQLDQENLALADCRADDFFTCHFFTFYTRIFILYCVIASLQIFDDDLFSLLGVGHIDGLVGSATCLPLNNAFPYVTLIVGRAPVHQIPHTFPKSCLQIIFGFTFFPPLGLQELFLKVHERREGSYNVDLEYTEVLGSSLNFRKKRALIDLALLFHLQLLVEFHELTNKSQVWVNKTPLLSDHFQRVPIRKPKFPH